MKRVIVSVKSTQRDADGEDTVVELVSSGKYYETALAKHIIYDESEVTGLGNTKTTIRIRWSCYELVNFLCAMSINWGRLTLQVWKRPMGRWNWLC